MAEQALERAIATCPACGTQVAPSLLACPACRRLIHGPELSALAAAAESSARSGHLSAALAEWRRALELLPPDTAQAATIRERVTALSRQLDAQGGGPRGVLPRWLAPLGLLGVALWKVKFLLVFVSTKGKLLLLGLTKSSTLFSMLISLGVYWTVWGWAFALGFVLSIYIHEMGHVAALRHFGIPASAPMFVPGVGAFVRSKQYPATPVEDARVGLAGPIWGTGAALVSYAIYFATGRSFFGAIAHAGAVINLFNLLPVWQLDGGRGMRALARGPRAVLAGLIAACWLVSGEPLFVLLALAAGWRAFGKDAPAESDRRTLLEFAALLVTLAALAAIDLPELRREGAG